MVLMNEHLYRFKPFIYTGLIRLIPNTRYKWNVLSANNDDDDVAEAQLHGVITFEQLNKLILERTQRYC